MFCSMKSVAVLFLGIFCCVLSADDVCMNHIQVIGTHNSYHVQPKEPLFSQIREVNPEAALAWSYSHPPLNVQLDNGVRNLEIDTFYDPEEIRVLHNPEYDFETTCETFEECLETLLTWSEANPDHVPIIVLVQAKRYWMEEGGEAAKVFAADALNQLDAELLSVFPLEKLIMPDDVRGDAKTLEAAILSNGWPTLEQTRGRFLFALHDRLEISDVYAKDRPSLEGRPMFSTTRAGRPDASILVINNPTDPEITVRVKQGYIVRTRADANVKEPEAGDTHRRDAALASGAHIVTTDFPVNQPHPETGYFVSLPGGVAARCHPWFSHCEGEVISGD